MLRLSILFRFNYTLFVIVSIIIYLNNTCIPKRHENLCYFKKIIIFLQLKEGVKIPD